MANDTDFIALYQALGVRPGCALDEFRQAYRRRVAQLHPDRQLRPTEHTPELQHLNALYTAAMQFQLQHGRLPGIAPAATPRMAPPRPQRAPHEALPTPPQRRRYVRWVFAIVALAGVAMYWNIEGSLEPQVSTLATVDAPVRTPARADAALRQIQLGMTAVDVLATQGEPVSRNETLWEYGPSWIAFECGQVSNWYSSPIRPLKVAAREPALQDRERASRARGRCRSLSLPPTSATPAT
jgi:hypothetical protein